MIKVKKTTIWFILLLFSAGGGGLSRRVWGQENQGLPTPPGPAGEQERQEEQELSGLLSLSLEELLEIEVISVTKKGEKQFEAPAAVYVITGEDIRRSGATSIAEALRMAPGLEVARIDASKWAITARGFNETQGASADKLLVMVDGRVVHPSFYSGVWWDTVDVMLEDIERIEVVRGPGGTLWGSDAVNGMINIITKEAQATQGTLLTGGGGTQERGFGGVRYGGRWGQEGYFRVYARYFNRDEGFDAQRGSSGADDWEALRSGFRVDWDRSEQERVTFQGDIYEGAAGHRMKMASFNLPYTFYADKNTYMRGGNILGRWQRRFSDDSEMTLKSYYDRMVRNSVSYGDRRDTIDVDFEHRFNPWQGHEILWGLGCRYTINDTQSSLRVRLDPSYRTDYLFSGFVQDEISLVPNRLRLVLGSKFERNEYTGFEYQPSGRLAWTPKPDEMIWAGVSRAVQIPLRGYSDSRVDTRVFAGPAGMPTVIRVMGNDNLSSQELLAYELGYRKRSENQWYVDLTGFYYQYKNLLSNEAGVMTFEPTPAPAHYVIPSGVDNKVYGESFGAELNGQYQVSPGWWLGGGYSFLQMQLQCDRTSVDTVHENVEDNSPRQQFHLRSNLDLGSDWELDTLLYYTDSLSALEIAGYLRLDVRLGWRITDNLELSVVGQNLLDDKHPEYGSSAEGAQPTEAPRGFYAKISCRF